MTTIRARYHDEWRGRIRQAMADSGWQTVDDLTRSVFGQWGRDPQRLADLLQGMLDAGEVEAEHRLAAATATRYRLRECGHPLPVG